MGTRVTWKERGETERMCVFILVGGEDYKEEGKDTERVCFLMFAR